MHINKGKAYGRQGKAPTRLIFNIVYYLYEHKYLRIDLIKINCCLNVPFMIWFLYVLNSIMSELQCDSYSVYRASRTHGLFYYSAHLAGILCKMFA